MYLRLISFVWTIFNVEKIISVVNFPEIREEVNNVVSRKVTPAYDLIGYFSLLDSSENLSEKIRNELKRLLKIHNDEFVKRILSLGTQQYINTHRSKKIEIEQSVCSLLKIPHVARSRHRRI